MPEILNIKEELLVRLKALLRKQTFAERSVCLRNPRGAMDITFESVGDSPDALVVVLSFVPEHAQDEVIVANAYRIQVIHSRFEEADAPNDLSLGLTGKQYEEFIEICTPAHGPLSAEQQIRLDEIVRQFGVCLDSLSKLRENLRSDSFTISTELVEAARGYLDDAFGWVEESSVCMKEFKNAHNRSKEK